MNCSVWNKYKKRERLYVRNWFYSFILKIYIYIPFFHLLQAQAPHKKEKFMVILIVVREMGMM